MIRSISKFFALILICCFVSSVVFAGALGTTPKKWTFIIFMNGNNSLDDFARQNLKSLEQVGSNDDVNIVVQWASLESRTVKRLYVEKSSDPSEVTSPVIEDLGSVDMGNYHSLEDFIKWSVENYPADHYFVDVWDHGSGWNLKKPSRDISSDDLTGNRIKTEELGLVMAYAKQVMGHNVDIYGSDACLMAMIEVAGQMADSVNYFVGSQELEPGEGWPYKELMQGWEANPNITPKEVAQLLVKEYIKAYSGGVYGNNDATLSALDLRQLTPVYKALTKYAKALSQLNASQRANVVAALGDVQSFSGFGIIDLQDLLNHLQSLNLVDDELYTKLNKRLQRLIVANDDTAEYKNAHGLSIWFPGYKLDGPSGRDARYKQLIFNQKTYWGSMLDSVLQGQHVVA